MSANLHVDFGNTLMFPVSIVNPVSFASGAAYGLSGGIVGQWIDLRNTDTYCGVWVAAGQVSGPLAVQVQTAYGLYDVPLGILGSGSVSGNIFSGAVPLSGNFTDPTSGLAQLPTWFSSGGILYVNSGLYTLPGAKGASGQLVNGYTALTIPFGTNPVFNAQCPQGEFPLSGTAPVFCSGGFAMANFQRNYQYARLLLLSGATTYTSFTAGFIAQLDTTSSGGGYSFQPLGGNVNV